MSEILEMARLALRITTTAFDSEIIALIQAAIIDIELAGVVVNLQDPLCKRAIVTYCKLNFGAPEEYDRLKASYDEQKAQMGMATGYTVWTDL